MCQVNEKAMQTEPSRAGLPPRRARIFLAVGAVAAGFLNALVGAGGGIVLYFLFGALYGKGAKDNLILSSAAVLFFCAVSLFFYPAEAMPDVQTVLFVGIPAALGGLCGAWLLRLFSPDAARKLFAALILISGILMLIRR